MDNQPDGQDQGPAPEQPAPNFGFQEDDDQWQAAWELLVHRGVNIIEPPPPNYPEGSWTLDHKEPAFPFNLEATWYCATLVGLLLAIHLELDMFWLWEHGFFHYAFRLFSTVMLTVLISFASTVAFEVVANLIDLFREILVERITFHVETWVVRVETHFDLLNRFPPYEHLLRPVHLLFVNSALAVYNFSFVISTSFLSLYFISWLTPYTLTAWITRISLPTPDINNKPSLRFIILAYVFPIQIQIWIASFLYLSVFVCMSISEKRLMLGGPRLDGFWKLAAEVMRATTMHLLSYTAYQVVCVCIAAGLPYTGQVDSYCGDLFKKYISRWYVLEISPAAGLLVLVAHWVVKGVCKLYIKLFWPLCVEYILWLSFKTRAYAGRNWIAYGPFLDLDMDVLDPANRVQMKVAMTTLFGLKSSWPVRLRFSAFEDEEEDLRHWLWGYAFFFFLLSIDLLARRYM
ncbi:hypothetical protein F5Y04DRAFT_290243 [Hypomontagnella monticulosa]|nr:hypothetical protein F5Y04DRAFT_290243 [Hypomontagnella monticulosa]